MTPIHSSKQAGSAAVTVLSIILFGTILGVLLLLMFGNRTGGKDTVSAVNSGVAGTSVVAPASTEAKPAESAASTQPAATPAAESTANTAAAPTATPETKTEAATGTDKGTASPTTPVEGEAAQGSAGAAVASMPLEQTIDDKAFKGTGAQIYVQACQSCHMPGGKGATGGGGMWNYPALANNPKLKTAQYPITILLYGNGGMPSFGHYMSDEQISEVVNYIRSDLNKNTDKVTPADVKKMRQPGQHYMIYGEAAG